jgi:hypothetical protein
MNSEQTQSLLTLARLIGGAISSERDVADGILATCVQCRDAKAPDDFTNVGMAVRQAILAQAPRAGAPLRSDLQYLVDRQSTIELANLHTLGQIARLIGHHGLQANEEAVLLGDAAVLLGLYRSLSVYQASLWVVAVREALTLPQQPWATEVLNALPFDLHFGLLGRLDEPLSLRSEVVEIGGARWRIPTGELLVTLLAARVGEPEAVATPPTWFHLAVAMLAWRNSLSTDVVLEIANELEIAPKVHRGFAVVRMVFPELHERFAVERFEVPLWERLLARPGVSDETAEADTETAINQSLP